MTYARPVRPRPESKYYQHASQPWRASSPLPQFRVRKRRTGRPGPPASSSVLGGKRKLFLEDGLLNTWRNDREGLGAVHDDGGND